MKKKVFKIVLISLLVSLGIAYLVLYCIFPAKTQEITWLTFDYICNKPLPVIGVSALVVGVILYKIISFVLKNKHLKYNELKAELQKIKEEDEAKINELTDKIAEILEKMKQTGDDLIGVNNNIKQLYNTIPNKKVNKLGEKLYEPTNSSEETKTI